MGSFSAVTAVFSCNSNVVRQCTLFGGKDIGTSSSSLNSMSSGIDSSPDDSCESSAGALLPFDGIWAVYSSCEGFGAGVSLGSKYGISMSSSSSVSWPSSLSSSALTYLGGAG